MKKIILLLLMFLFSLSLFAEQPLIKFYINDGSTQQYNISDIENIGILNGSISYVMKIFYRDSLTAYYYTNNIDSIKFESDIYTNQLLNILSLGKTDSYKLSEIDSINFIKQPFTTITLDSMIAFTYPTDSIPKSEKPFIKKTFDSLTEIDAQIAYDLEESVSSLGYEIRINIGKILPDIFDYPITIKIPDSILIHNGYEPSLFTNIIQETGEEEFFKLNTVFDVNTKKITGNLPIEAFSNLETSDSSYEAIITISLTPITSKIEKKKDIPQDNTLTFSPPLSNITITGPIQKYRTIPRIGKHMGTDFRAEMRTPVYSVFNGKVIGVSPTSTGIKTVTIKDNVTGLKVRYLHLDSYSLKKDTTVSSGDLIGMSGNSGWQDKKKTKPYKAHLHLEYFDSNNDIPDTAYFDSQVKDIVKKLVRFKVTLDDNLLDNGISLTLGKTSILKAEPIDIHGNAVEASHNDHWDWDWQWIKWLNLNSDIYNCSDFVTSVNNINLIPLKTGEASIEIQLHLKGTENLIEKPLEVDTIIKVKVSPDPGPAIDSAIVSTGLDSLVNAVDSLKKLAHSGKGFFIFSVSVPNSPCSFDVISGNIKDGNSGISGFVNGLTYNIYKSSNSYRFQFDARPFPKDKCSGGNFYLDGSSGLITANITNSYELYTVTCSNGLAYEGYGGSYYTPYSNSSSTKFISFIPK